MKEVNAEGHGIQAGVSKLTVAVPIDSLGFVSCNQVDTINPNILCRIANPTPKTTSKKKGKRKISACPSYPPSTHRHPQFNSTSSRHSRITYKLQLLIISTSHLPNLIFENRS